MADYHVQVRNHLDKLVDTATVSLRKVFSLYYPPEQDTHDPQSVSHEPKGGGWYSKLNAAPSPASGELWVLIVSAPRFSTVVQPVRIGTPVSPSTTLPLIPEPRQALTVSFPGHGVVAPGGHKPTALVKLLPASEVVMVAGHGFETHESSAGSDKVPSQVAYRRNMLFHPFAAGAAQPHIDEGTHVLVYSMLDSRAQRSSWLRVFVRALGAQWLLIGERYDITSVTQIYEHLNDVGTRAPRSVREVSFLGHAWLRGPILTDTIDNKVDYLRERDGADRDPRPKDFDPPNLSRWSSLPTALHPEGHWRVWGCYSSPRMVRLAALLTRSGRNAGFGQLRSADKHGRVTVENANGRIAEQVYWQHLLMFGYASRASRLLANTHHVYGTAPGTWTMYNQQKFYVPWGDPPYLTAPADQGSFRAIQAYLSTTLQQYFQRDSDGFLNYSQLAGKDIPSVPPSSQYICVIEAPSRQWAVYFHHYPLLAGTGTGPPSVTSRVLPDVSDLLSGVAPPIPVGMPGTIHVISEGRVPRDCFIVVEDALPNAEGGLRVFRMNHINGAPGSVGTEYRPHHRVRALATSVKAGTPVWVRYWEVPAGGTVTIAELNCSAQDFCEIVPIPQAIAGEVDIRTTGLKPGLYVVRCYDGAHALLGESHDPIDVS